MNNEQEWELLYNKAAAERDRFRTALRAIAAVPKTFDLNGSLVVPGDTVDIARQALIEVR
jgi:hypothetical protein